MFKMESPPYVIKCARHITYGALFDP